MELSDVVIMFTFNEERYRVKLSKNQISKVSYPRKCDIGIERVKPILIENAIKEMGFSDGWVDCTLLNDKLGKVNSASLGKILESLGYTDVFRIKLKRRNHYIRYSPFIIEKDEVVRRIKNPVN